MIHFSIHNPLIILASSSMRRQELVKLLQLPVEIRVSEADESVPEDWGPEQIVEELSLRKAAAVWEQLQDEPSDQLRLVIGSDTIVVQDGAVLGKPQDEADASRMLHKLQGRSHHVYSGVCCLLLPPSGIKFPKLPVLRLDRSIYKYRSINQDYRIAVDGLVGFSTTSVVFRSMASDEISRYIETGEPKDKAGAYGVQGVGGLFVERIDGDFYSVMGLPVNMLYEMVKQISVLEQ